MGSLSHFNLAGLAQLHGLKHFVETGTAQGDGLALAAQVKQFGSLHSIEIMPELVVAAEARFRGDQRVTIWRGDSREMLERILDVLPAEPTLFWLDAHFPGAHSGADYSAEANLRRRLPLEDEVAMLATRRAGVRDVLLIDDARIYQPGPYGGGDLPADWPPLKGVKRSLDFVRDAYGPTHGIVTDYADQGYVMVVPRAQLKAAA